MGVIGLPKNELEKLYSSGKSMSEISQILKVSVHKVLYWMHKNNINRRSLSDAAYIKANPNGNPYYIDQKAISRNQLLFGLGLGIYWGEGNKSSPHSLRVTNSDPRIIKCFRTFLLACCGVLPERIQYSLICFNDSNSTLVLDHWSKELQIPIKKFGTIVQIPTQGKGTYRKKSQTGVCTITFNNVKLKKWVMDQINLLPG